MLDAFIIEELRKRQEEELAHEAERPRLEIPAYGPYNQPEPVEDKKSTVITLEM